jgi:hypothetical protein
MSQYEVIAWFAKKYEENTEAHYSASQVAKEMKGNKHTIYYKINKLFFFGYLVARYQPRRTGKTIHHGAGYQYRINPARVNTIKLTLNKERNCLNNSSIQEEKITNLCVNANKTSLKVPNGSK